MLKRCAVKCTKPLDPGQYIECIFPDLNFGCSAKFSKDSSCLGLYRIGCIIPDHGCLRNIVCYVHSKHLVMAENIIIKANTRTSILGIIVANISRNKND